MAFTGLASNETNTASLIQRDIADIIRTLSPKETPFLDWLGDAPVAATSIKHEFIEDVMLPNTITTSTAIASAAVATPISIQIAPAGIGLSLNIGQLLRNESSAPEVYQVQSITGAGNSITVTRDYNGTTVAGSLAVGSTLYVGETAAIEGADHSGGDTRRLGTARANTVGLFRMELAQSTTQFNIGQVGNDQWEGRKAKALIDGMRQLENAVIKGVLNGTNSLGTTTATRTLNGIQAQLTSINSTTVSASFVANPHLYVGNVWQNAYDNGASPTETWGIVLGSTWFKAMSDLNDTKVQDSNASEQFKRVIRTYTGPFGSAELFLCRNIQATEMLLVPRERLVVPNLQNSSFTYLEMGQQGDNRKGLVRGEYTLELHHQSAMARQHA